MQCAFHLIPFPLSSCCLDASLLGGGGRTTDPLTSCPSQNRCLPRLSEERDGGTLSDISDRPMRSQASAAAPMDCQGRARFPGSRAGQAGPPAASESPPLTLPAAAPATPGGGAPPGRTARAFPNAAQLPRLSGSRGGSAHAPGRRARRWAGRRGEIGHRGDGEGTMARRPGAPAGYGEEFTFVSPLVKYLLFFFNMLFWVSRGVLGAPGLQGTPRGCSGLSTAEEGASRNARFKASVVNATA